MGACQACLTTNATATAKVSVVNQPSGPNGQMAVPSQEPRVLKGKKKSWKNNTTEKHESVMASEIIGANDAHTILETARKEISSCQFADWFPELDHLLADIEDMTDFQHYKLRLKFATDDELSAGTRQFFKTQMASIIESIDAELHSVLGGHWTSMKAQSNSMVAIHSILVLWSVSKDPIFLELSPENQNVLKWACLLHDIAKRGSPTIQGRDYMHAFRSAAASLEVFEQLGIVEGGAKAHQWSQVRRLLQESFQPLPAIWREDFRHGTPMVTQMHSHHNLPEIFHYLWVKQLAPRGTFVDLVFRIILFHHSVESLDTHPNKLNLSEKEQTKWTDSELLGLLKIFLIADNESYIIFDESHIVRCRREILRKYKSLSQSDIQPDSCSQNGEQSPAGKKVA